MNMSTHEFNKKNYPSIPWGISYVMELKGTFITKDAISWVKKCLINDKVFYVKYYRKGGKGLRRWFGRSRIRGEWENLNYFADLGIPTPLIVAYEEKYSWGFFKEGFLVTEEVCNTCNLKEFFESGFHKKYNKKSLKAMIKKIAEYTKLLHKQKFAHQDLKWRNILVTLTKEPNIYFIDCPLGNHVWQLKRKQLKDLAHLDKLAKVFLTPKLRLYFYHCYKDIFQLTKKDKTIIRYINNYWD